MFLRSHRNVSGETLEFATCLNDVGVRKCQVIGHFAHMAGGFLNVGFTKKDLYNKMEKDRRSRYIDGDANTLLAIMEDKVKLDNLFHYNYELNASGKLAGLFWADSTSRLDYCSFGDMLLFDSMYRSNQY
ncbi:hypothetical protein IFM89_022779 [Coptis chinensis]|uniref:Protein FAR1-RELATED SEQUENCE n=1 Tax=Coptis chinensis TaxID=261450 RepID=A0A835IXX2_9MAGN|nr:hypothetical protein IFM89_022779 [Coptis chinensis]